MLLSKLEGIIPALESAHAIAHVAKVAPQMKQGPDHRRLPVGPRRQGCLLGRRMRWEKNCEPASLTRFADLKKEGRAAFVPFITAGDPDMETSLRHPGKAARRGRRCDRAGHALHRSHGRRSGGAGLVAAGAEGRRHHGPDARAGARNSAKPTSKTPIVLMGYYNPIHAYGTARFARDAAAAGVDGLIVVDLPPEEDEVLRVPAKAQGVDLIRLVTPTTDEARLSAGRSTAPAAIFIMSRSPASPAPRAFAEDEVRAALARIRSGHRSALSRWASASARRSRPAPSPASPTPWWWARPSSAMVAENLNAGRDKIVAEVLELMPRAWPVPPMRRAVIRWAHELDHQYRPSPHQEA